MLRKRITEAELLQSVSDTDIFNHYFGHFSIGKAYKSPLRKDENPSVGFYEGTNERIYFKDFATEESISSVSYVQKLCGLSYMDTLDKIATEMGVYSGNISKKVVRKPPKKAEKIINIRSGKWSDEELNYWYGYHITAEELKENQVYPVKELKINNYLIQNPEKYLRFAYLVKDLDGKDYIKVYSPFDKQYKWVSNVPNTLPFGLYELPFKSRTLIITKGQKDRIVWKKYFTDVIAAQHEGKECLTPEVLQLIKNNYDDVWINFDSDKTGKEKSMYFTSTYGWKHINVPDIYLDRLGIKDFADFVKERGLPAFEKFLKHKGVL